MISPSMLRRAFAAPCLALCCAGGSVDPELYASAQRIDTGCSGGIMGFIERVSVHRDGRVEYELVHSRLRPGPESVPRAEAEAWFQALETARFFERSSPEREPVADGVACGIALAGPQRTHWLDVTPELDKEIRRVFDAIRGLAGKPGPVRIPSAER